MNSFPRLALLIFCAIAFVPGHACAEEQRGNAIGLLNGYLLRAAANDPQYRTDIQPGGDPAKVPPGRVFAKGRFLGPFTYRPLTYNELSPAQRSSLLQDPRLHAYLAQLAQTPRTIHITISPEEMLSTEPLIVTVPSQ